MRLPVTVPDVWEQHFERERSRYEDGTARLPDEPDERQRQLTRIANAAAGAGLALLMQARRKEAAEWLARAAERYRESFTGAPAGSWGRPIGAVKACLLAGDSTAAVRDARWALETGAAESDSSIGRYAGCLALLVLGRDGEAEALSVSLLLRDDFPGDVADALHALATGEEAGYASAVKDVLRSFETRDSYLEDIPVADTVIVLQALAAERGLAVPLDSPLLPAPG